MIDMVDKKDFEVFEIHTMPRGLVCLTLKLKVGTSIWVQTGIGGEKVTIPKGAMHIVTGDTEEPPDECLFLPATKSMRKVHKRIDYIRNALSNPNLEFYIKGAEFKLKNNKDG